MKKRKLIAISYYGTVICLILFVLSIFVFGGGILFLLYMFLGLLLLWGVVSILEKFFPEVWVTIIFYGVAITALHLYLQSWLLTLLLTCMAVLYVFTAFKMKNKKRWPDVILIAMSLLISFHYLFQGNEDPPEVTEEAIQSAISAMEDDDQVKEAFIGVNKENENEDEDIIYCALEVKDTTTLGEKQSLGTACAGMIADEVGKDSDLDVELYDHYILEISIASDKMEHVIYTRKGTESPEIRW